MGYEITRRALLRALGAGALGWTPAACIVPSRPPPVIVHPRYPVAPIPRRRVPGARGVSIGAASIDLTPPPGSRVWLAGFGFQRLMRAIRDPICARTLFFDDGMRRVALIVADVVGLLHPTVARVRRLVGNGIDVAVASTHNHQGPDTMGYWGRAMLYALPHETGIDRRYQRIFERRLATSVALAAERAVPAELSFVRATIPAGLVQNLRGPGTYDGTLEVVEAISTEDGSPIATLVNFGCHPETLGDRAHAMTADFPGRLRERIEEARGGKAVFTNGSLGGMVTLALDRGLDERARGLLIDRAGDAFARAALEALARADRVQVDAVRYWKTSLEIPSRNELFSYVERVGLVEPRARGREGGIVTEVGRIDLGPASFALVPGEPSPKVGLRIKDDMRRRGSTHPTVIALGNDELGYVLDPGQYDDPEYAYEVSVSLGREAAPRIEAGLRSLPPPSRHDVRPPRVGEPDS